MKIGIYKIKHRTIFNGEDESEVMMNPEVRNCAILLSRRHEVVMLSDCDLENSGNPRSGELDEECDKYIVFNGSVRVTLRAGR